MVENNEFKNVRDGKVISAYSLEELVWRGNRSNKVRVENPKPMYWSVTER